MSYPFECISLFLSQDCASMFRYDIKTKRQVEEN